MVSTLMSLQTSEVEIVGGWILQNGNLVADPSAKRISDLIERDLDEVARSEGGWSVLYRDRNDGRLWELSYPDSEEHGGGAPCLKLLTLDGVRTKFGKQA